MRRDFISQHLKMLGSLQGVHSLGAHSREYKIFGMDANSTLVMENGKLSDGQYHFHSECGAGEPACKPSCNSGSVVIRETENSISCCACPKGDTANKWCKHASSTVSGHHFYYHIDFCHLAIFLAAVPLLALVVCLLIAVVWQADKVNDTMCKVDNFIPSISAITSISPQRYIWRISIALHAGPRFLFGCVYHAYFRAQVGVRCPLHQTLFRALLKLNAVLYMVETSGLIGTTYISNVENYPVHEKLFITYMVSSILYMINTCIIFSICDMETKHTRKSLKIKVSLLGLVVLSTAGLLYFFFQHRWYCTPGAFSWFSFCEYWIAVGNVAFHFTAYWDFEDHRMVFGKSAAEVDQRGAASSDGAHDTDSLPSGSKSKDE